MDAKELSGMWLDEVSNSGFGKFRLPPVTISCSIGVYGRADIVAN